MHALVYDRINRINGKKPTCVGVNFDMLPVGRSRGDMPPGDRRSTHPQALIGIHSLTMNPPAEKNRMHRLEKVVFLPLRLCLGMLFLIAGISKVVDPGQFLVAVRSFQILADPWAPLAALCLPWLEVLLGLCLLAKRCYHAALLLTGSLLTTFLCAGISAWIRDLQIECGCIGPGSGSGDPLHLLARNLVLLLVIAGLAWQAFTSGNDHRRVN